MPVKIRTVYFKTSDMNRIVSFWSAFLDMKPHKTFDEWHEFQCENINLGFLLLDEQTSNSTCVPVFEFDDDEVHEWIERAKKAGAEIIFDELDNPDILSVGFKDPDGNEFEVSKFHK